MRIFLFVLSLAAMGACAAAPRDLPEDFDANFEF